MSEDSKRKDRPGDQLMPHEGIGPWIQDLVLEDLRHYGTDIPCVREVMQDVEDRKQLGLARYGRLLQACNGRDALRDACDEATDLLIYLRQCLAEAQESGTVDLLRNAYDEAITCALILRRVRRP